jgi:tRNA pseudouridine38-40 synthase
VASAVVTRSIDIGDLRRALNGLLPPAIRVIDVQSAADGFNARFAARSKTYRYRMSLGETCSPFDRQYAWHLRGPLDVDAMAAAARRLEGRHDFSAFRASGGGPATSIRTIERSALTGQDPLTGVGGRALGRLIVYDVTADGFLRHMVRNIVGTLVEIGRRRLAAETIVEVMESRDRDRAGPTAPAHGLFLDSVRYDDAGSGSIDAEG